jgi:phage terminase Nu1 subunit (DNA packaging protein)
MARRKPNNTNDLRTQRELADALDVSVSVVNSYLRDERWTFARKPDWPRRDVEAMLQWREDNLVRRAGAEAGSLAKGDGDELKQLRKIKLAEEIEKIREQKLLARQTRRRVDGELVETAKVQQWLIRNIRPTSNMLTGIPARAVPLIQGRTEGEQLTILDNLVRETLEQVANLADDLGDGLATA